MKVPAGLQRTYYMAATLPATPQVNRYYVDHGMIGCGEARGSVCDRRLPLWITVVAVAAAPDGRGVVAA